jgi:hypothetical protein
MKKIIALMCCAVLVFSGCSKEADVNADYSTTIGGQDAVISFLDGTLSEGTITAENGTYSFSYSMDGTLSIVYPNGYTYSQSDLGGAIATPADYNADTIEEWGYIDGYSLAWAISSASDSSRASKDTNGVPAILSLIIFALGIWFVWSPKSAWWMARGWWFKNAEPSDLALILYRGGGCLLVLFGIISFFA